MRRTIEQIRCKLDKFQSVLFPAVSGIISVACLAILLTQINIAPPQTAKENASYTLLATTSQPEAILALTGIQTSENDEVLIQSEPNENANLAIERTFPVTLAVDGQTITNEMSHGTVSDLLTQNNISLGENDLISPSLDTPLARDMQVTVNRVTYQEVSRRAEVTDEKLEEYKATLPEESLNAFTKSKSRIYDVVYLETLVDGEVTSSELHDLKAVYHPYDAPSNGFLPGVPVSTIDEFDGIELGEDGLPTTYTRKISNAVATAYSASAGRGAGGQGLYCGTVAVNPAVIPYGTRLFITSADGRFVYGYAIASDTGGAMMEGRVDVDLYFESNAECYAFGKRSLDIYVLD